MSDEETSQNKEKNHKKQDEDELLGTEFAGCKILQKLGSGGMGSVYKAQHLGLDKIVCIKILPPQLAKNQRNVEFFLREARSIAHLEHPNILQVYHIGREKDTYYIIMSYIEGHSLADIIKTQGPLEFSKATDIIKGILNGLEAAHKKQIIHRDIKPSNILIAKNEQPKIVDFGLAKKIHDDKSLTVTGEMVGTAYFMAPEQGLGKLSDHRTDLYSVGVTYFYILTGKYPYDGKNSIEVIHKHIADPVPDITKINPEIPAWTASIIEKMMQKEPIDRFQSAQEALDTISRQKIPQIKPKQLKDTKEDSLSHTLKIKTIPPQEIQPKKVSVESFRSYEDLIKKRFLEKTKRTTMRALLTANIGAGMEIRETAKTPPEDKQVSAKLKKEFKLERKQQKRMEKIQRLKYSAKKIINTSFFGFFAIINFGSWFSLGRVCLQNTRTDLAGFEFLLSPWTGEQFAQNQLLLLALGIFLTTVLLVLSVKKIFSINSLSLIILPVAAYAAAMNGLNKEFYAVSKITFAGLFSSSNMIIYAVITAVLAVKFLRMIDKTPLEKITVSALCALSFWFTWYFSSASSGSARSAFVFLILGIIFLITALVLSFSQEVSFWTVSAPGIFFVFSLVSVWGYSASRQADKIAAAMESKQEIEIQKAAIAKKLAEDKEDEKAKEIIIPERKSLSYLQSIAWKRAYLKPLADFDKNSSKNGSYLLIALIAFVFSVGRFIMLKFKSRYLLDYEL